MTTDISNMSKPHKLSNGATYGYAGNGERVCTGSQMGRRDTYPDELIDGIRLHLYRLKWVDGDYDEGGAYWGQIKGEYIYCAWTHDDLFGEAEVFVRATCRAEAKEKVIADFEERGVTPVFYRVPKSVQEEEERGRLVLDMDEFTRGYVGAALWSSVDEQDNKLRTLEDFYGWKFRQVAGKWMAVPKSTREATPDELRGHEYKFEAVDAAWEFIGGGCDDTHLDAHYKPIDIALGTLKGMILDCEAFQTENAAKLVEASEHGMEDSTAGYCLWMKRNCTGCSFNDRDLPEFLEDALNAAAKKMSTLEHGALYVGDDGKIHWE